ncbi:hypothetical protein MKW94_026134 [Papaver nudicaule]|uniref:LOB domain-containing protein n=1 Tax=Papaver nudicaule TaxID=74823 RepID=A0AA41S1P1_PAPNU|nr:hypothetical protein [Papaver nudicaule]
MTVKGGTNHACAACKYQRRKCAPDCVLAPYFPHDQPKMFQNAHKLFGVSNIQKILKPLTPDLKREATKSIIYEANMRDKFPVTGCCTVIRQLQYQIGQAEAELRFVISQLSIYRQQNHMQTPPQLQLGSLATAAVSSSSPDYNTLSLFQQQSYDENDNASIVNGDGGASIMPIQSFSNENEQGYGNDDVRPADHYVKNEIVNPLWIQHDFNTADQQNNNSTRVPPHEFFVEQPVSFQQEPDVLESQDYDEMPAFFDAIDDKEGYESSPESSQRDATQSIEHVSECQEFLNTENELKNAAACFSLTSVN